MNDLRLTPQHDLVLIDGDFQLINNEAEVAKQTLKINLLTLRGEWWENSSIGIPYIQEIVKKGVNKDFVDGIIRNAIENSYNISAILEFSSRITSDRRYLVENFKATTLDGAIISITNQVV